MEFVETLDDYGKPAWITLMVVGFIVFWPIGLGVLAYLIWSGHMGCKSSSWKRSAKKKWNRAGTVFRATGNTAFDEYREETLMRLEDEAEQFQTFLGRLRAARDKAEFDQFMADRNGKGGRTDDTAGSVPQTS